MTRHDRWAEWEDDDPAIQLGRAYLRRESMEETGAADVGRTSIDKPEPAPASDPVAEVEAQLARAKAGEVGAGERLAALLARLGR